jgi:DHA2 family multidrug resistance protein
MNTAAVTHRGPITLGLMLSTIMSILDTTVVNVSMPHMQGTLSASSEQITWVVTSYIVATAVMTPITGWLANRVGLKTLVLIAVAGFTLASMLCGIAANMLQMVFFRALQGVASAPIAPICQAVLLNINPPERYGRATALFMMGNVAAPVVGPIVGAWLTESLSWRWCFYINLPAGICSMLLLWTFMPRATPQARRFDFLGFGSLALGIAALQLMLDRGPSQDWFGSREIRTEAAVAAAAFYVFLAHVLTAKRPLFDARLARDRNFVSTTILSFFLNMPLYAGITLLPLMMQGLMGYSAMISGLMSVPRGLLMMATLVIIGRLDAIVDRRVLVATGLFFCVLGFWRMTGFSLSMGTQSIVWAGALQGIGQGIIFVPLATLAFATVDPVLRPEATAIANLVRNLAGSLGIALMQALTAFNTQAMHAALAAHITPGSLALHSLPNTLPLHSAKGALALNAEITRQAMMVAYIDDFWLMIALGVVCAPLLLLLRKPRPGAAVRATGGDDTNSPATPEIVP